MIYSREKERKKGRELSDSSVAKTACRRNATPSAPQSYYNTVSLTRESGITSVFLSRKFTDEA